MWPPRLIINAVDDIEAQWPNGSRKWAKDLEALASYVVLVFFTLEVREPPSRRRFPLSSFLTERMAFAGDPKNSGLGLEATGKKSQAQEGARTDGRG